MEKGDFVIVKSVSNTERHIGLDSRGEMKGMIGKRFPLAKVTSHRAYIVGPKSFFTYTWHKDDLMLAKNIEKIKPQIFHFDIEHLTT